MCLHFLPPAVRVAAQRTHQRDGCFLAPSPLHPAVEKRHSRGISLLPAQMEFLLGTRVRTTCRCATGKHTYSATWMTVNLSDQLGVRRQLSRGFRFFRGLLPSVRAIYHFNVFGSCSDGPGSRPRRSSTRSPGLSCQLDREPCRAYFRSPPPSQRIRHFSPPRLESRADS